MSINKDLSSPIGTPMGLFCCIKQYGETKNSNTEERKAQREKFKAFSRLRNPGE